MASTEVEGGELDENWLKSGPGRGLERLPLKLQEENSMKTG